MSGLEALALLLPMEAGVRVLAAVAALAAGALVFWRTSRRSRVHAAWTEVDPLRGVATYLYVRRRSEGGRCSPRVRR